MSERVAIADLARVLHPRTEAVRPMALLTAYFDESGTSGDAPITVIAGFVGTESQWTAVEAQWTAVLAEFADKGVTRFHMTECVNQAGQFERIDSFWRDYVLNRLSGILHGSGLQAIWSGVDVRDFEREADDGFLKRYPKPYDLCIDDIAIKTKDWAREKAPGSDVAVMFSKQNEYESRAARIFDAYQRQQKWHQHISSFTFASPDKVVPLQTADMIAYEACKEWENVRLRPMTFENNFGIRDRLWWITNGQLQYGALYADEGMRGAVDKWRQIQRFSSSRSSHGDDASGL